MHVRRGPDRETRVKPWSYGLDLITRSSPSVGPGLSREWQCHVRRGLDLNKDTVEFLSRLPAADCVLGVGDAR